VISIETSTDLKSFFKGFERSSERKKRMGNARKVEDDDNNNNNKSSSSVLIAATMCIIGLQVHVHVKDGSVFSGIFFTASVDNGFGIVLKDARITKKGTSISNVASGSVVDTLVILSSTIVQIIAEVRSFFLQLLTFFRASLVTICVTCLWISVS
jgi:small nuclear ribonucleoprotein (snRNP)-like protein